MTAATGQPTHQPPPASDQPLDALRGLLGSSAQAAGLVDSDLAVRWVNDAMLAVTGRDSSAALPVPLGELLHPAERVELLGIASSLLASDPAPSRIVRVQGRAVDQWLDLALTPVDLGPTSRALLLTAADATEAVRAQRAFALMSQNTLDLVVLVDPGGTVSWASPSIRTVLGHDPDALVGRGLAELAAGEDLIGLSDALATDDPRQPAIVRTVRFRSTSGAYRYMSVSARPVDSVGPGPFTAVALRDITEELRAKRELARSEEQFRMAMHGAPEGMAVTDSQDRIVQVNPALCELLGVGAAQLIGHRFREFIPEEDRAAVDEWHERMVRGNASIERSQHRLASTTSEVWVDHSLGAMHDELGNPQLFVHQFADRTAARRLQADLAYRASHDVQTGLANRDSLRTRLSQRLGLPPESTEYVGVLYCDIDDLKPTNDRFGHLVGDAVIAAVANRLERAVRRQDVVARVGGDEFVIVLDHCTSVEELAVVAGNVHAAASHSVETSVGPIDVSITVGAVLAESTAETDEALARADAELYRAKRAGRNRISVEGIPT